MSDIHPRYAAVLAHRDVWAQRIAAMTNAEIAGLEAALSDRRMEMGRQQ